LSGSSGSAPRKQLAADFLRANEDRVVDAVLPCTG
jgi:hypothetical protein